MKKLICAALAAGAMVAMADDAAKCEGTKCEQAKAVETAKPAAKRAPLTDAQKAERKAMYEKRMAEHKAAMETKILDTIKKYLPEEEKAKALMKDLEEVMKAGRRAMRPPMPKPAAAKPAEAK